MRVTRFKRLKGIYGPEYIVVNRRAKTGTCKCGINSKYLVSAALRHGYGRAMGININEPHIDTYVRANANYSIRVHARNRSSITCQG